MIPVSVQDTVSALLDAAPPQIRAPRRVLNSRSLNRAGSSRPYGTQAVSATASAGASRAGRASPSTAPSTTPQRAAASTGFCLAKSLGRIGGGLLDAVIRHHGQRKGPVLPVHDSGLFDHRQGRARFDLAQELDVAGGIEPAADHH